MKPIIFKKTDLVAHNEAYKKIMYWFFSHPTTEIGLNELAKVTKVSKSTAKRVVQKLAKEGFLKITPLANLWRITCNPHHQYNTTKKIAYNLELIYESGVLNAIVQNVPNAKSILLFGSYRKGDDLASSDLDLAVEVISNEETKIIELGIIPQLGYRKKVKVNMLKFTRNKIDVNLFANIANGIVLFGFLEVRP